MVFNEMLRETDFLRMTAFTMGVSTLDYNRTAATLNTNGLHHVGQSPQVEVKETAIGEVSSTLSVPPISVNIYRFPAVRTAE
jgi:hypothetical protein